MESFGLEERAARSIPALVRASRSTGAMASRSLGTCSSAICAIPTTRTLTGRRSRRTTLMTRRSFPLRARRSGEEMTRSRKRPTSFGDARFHPHARYDAHSAFLARATMPKSSAVHRAAPRPRNARRMPSRRTLSGHGPKPQRLPRSTSALRSRSGPNGDRS